MPEGVKSNDDVPASCAHTHSSLFHYTSEIGFRGIVESNSLWATYFGDLNDSKEIHELREPLVNELAVWFMPIIREFRQGGLRANQVVSNAGGNALAAKRLAQDWVNSLYTTTFEPDEAKRQSLCCITSFCSHANDQSYERENGLLSQWRGYGGEGGYCLVFDTAKLLTQLEKEKKSYFLLHLDLRPAHYFMESTPVSEIFSDLFAFSKEIVGATMNGNRDLSPEKIFRPFVSAATTTKHRGFYEEREVRLVALAATKVADDKIKHLPGYKPEPLKNQFTTERAGRVRHQISLFGKDCARLPLTRVIVGPSRNQDQNAQLARKIVGKEIPVTKSATPFIG